MNTNWIKARKSSGNLACVEVRLHNGVPQVCDSKDVEYATGGQAILTLTAGDFDGLRAKARQSA